MTPERYQHVKRVFHEVCDLSPVVQAAYLDRVCADDLELRCEVEMLLSHDQETLPVAPRVSAAAALGLRDIDASAPAATHKDDKPADITPDDPEHIGDYRVIRRIGQGGMGVVFEAEQDNPRRTIALKVIRPGVASSQLLKRFRFEASVLGRLQHPGIAQIYEAGMAIVRMDGASPSEQPFFAMEYVHGKTLDAHTVKHKLGIRQRLELFTKICDAVQHAHQKGVIHRDLKPGNILVDQLGQPKILDFGVARVTDVDVQVTTIQTNVGQLVGTIPYMSPEQVAGDPVDLDTRSDVYALGVICYELLTGHLPHQLQNKPLPDAIRTITESDPTPLGSINRSFRGDLNTIVGKALEKEKERRYQSASDLAADVRRYLADEPIAARPATTFYQMRKFARRNKALVTVVTVAFLALAGSLFHVTRERNRVVKAERLARERLTRIEAEAKNIRAINRFFNDMLASADPGNDGRDVRVADVLDRAAEGLGARLSDQPEVEASLQSTIGATYFGLGLFAEADPHLRAALETRARVLGENHRDTLTTMATLAGVLRELSKLDEAEELVRRVLAIHEAAAGTEHRGAANALNNLGDILQRQGRIAEAEETWRRSLAIQHRVLKSGDPLLGITINNLGQLLTQTRRLVEAEPLLRESLALQIASQGPEHPQTLASKANLAKALKALDKFDEAESLLREVIEVRRRTIGEHPALYTSLGNLAMLLRERERFAEAEPLTQESLEGMRKLYGVESRHTLIALNNRASLLVLLDRAAEAEPLYIEIGAAAGVLPAGHWMQRIFDRNYGECLTALGRFEEAEPLLLESFSALQAALGEQHRHTRLTREKIIALYESWGREDEAATWRARAAPEDE